MHALTQLRATAHAGTTDGRAAAVSYIYIHAEREADEPVPLNLALAGLAGLAVTNGWSLSVLPSQNRQTT